MAIWQSGVEERYKQSWKWKTVVPNHVQCSGQNTAIALETWRIPNIFPKRIELDTSKSRERFEWGKFQKNPKYFPRRALGNQAEVHPLWNPLSSSDEGEVPASYLAWPFLWTEPGNWDKCYLKAQQEWELGPSSIWLYYHCVTSWVENWVQIFNWFIFIYLAHILTDAEQKMELPIAATRHLRSPQTVELKRNIVLFTPCRSYISHVSHL